MATGFLVKTSRYKHMQPAQNSMPTLKDPHLKALGSRRCEPSLAAARRHLPPTQGPCPKKLDTGKASQQGPRKPNAGKVAKTGSRNRHPTRTLGCARSSARCCPATNERTATRSSAGGWQRTRAHQDAVLGRGGLIGSVRPPELLDSLLRRPGQLQRQVQAPPRVPAAPVRMQRDACPPAPTPHKQSQHLWDPSMVDPTKAPPPSLRCTGHRARGPWASAKTRRCIGRVACCA